MSSRLVGYNFSRDRLLLKPERYARLHEVEFIKSRRRQQKLLKETAMFSYRLT